MSDNAENIRNDDEIIKDSPYQGIIDLSDRQKKLKDNQIIIQKDDNEKHIAVANRSNMDIDEIVVKEKIDFNAWRNLKYRVNKPVLIKHKLPLMTPPERGRNKISQTKNICVRNEPDKQSKDVFDVEIQTDPAYFVAEDDYELIQYVKDNAITKEAIINLVYYDDDVNNNMENQSDFEQGSTPLSEAVPVPEDETGGEEQKVLNLIEKCSEENKATLSNFFGVKDKKMSDHHTGTNFKSEKHFFEFIINSLWQLVIFMSRHKAMVEKEDEKIKLGFNKSTQTSPDIGKNKTDGDKVAQTINLEEITMPQLPSQLPALEKCDILEQKMQAIHGNYQNIPLPTAPRPKDPRALNQQYKQAQKPLQNPLIKKPRLNSPMTSDATTFSSLNKQMQTTSICSPRWRFGNSNQFGGHMTRGTNPWRQGYHSNVIRPQWMNVMPPPPPPPPRYSQVHRFQNQPTSIMNQYQGRPQQQEMSEYQKYQQMEMQKKAWESQLQNYPNSAWSNPVQEN